MPIFSFVAECQHDVSTFAQTLNEKGVTFKMDVMSDPLDLPEGPRWMGEMCAELTVDKSLDELLDIMDQQEDSHVMMRSLRQQPLPRTHPGFAKNHAD
ncbi:hypothetical protein [Burkholderia phage FLC9]|nr:hypothetical protein [Burkholderia phage FLC9]